MTTYKLLPFIMTDQKINKHNIVEFLGNLITEKGGDSYLGEAVTMQDHMLQAAWQAENAGASDKVIAAALLHDIGHYVGEFGDDYIEKGLDNKHQISGARILERFFDNEVVQPVRLHVDAKRYLCAVDPEYVNELSEASIKTLALQGGPMSPTEVEAFEAQPGYQTAVQIRKYDDNAKDPDALTPPIEHYLQYVQKALEECNR